MALTGDLACMCPGLGIEPATRWFAAHAQSTKLHQPGLKEFLSQLKYVLVMSYHKAQPIARNGFSIMYYLPRTSVSGKAYRGWGINKFRTFSTCYSCQWFNVESPGGICSHQNHSGCSVIQGAGVGSRYCAWSHQWAWSPNMLSHWVNLVQLNKFLQSTA